jgi:hypothetical protein
MQVTWLEPWEELSAAQQTAFEQQLRRELPPGHPLLGVQATAQGHSGASDDVLFALSGHASAYAVVHLTWGGRSPDPRWPRTEFYRDWADFAQGRMRADHFGYAE